jgi:hypothetical protein
MNLGLASQSKIKIDAVKKFFADAGIDIVLKTLATETATPQPFGRDSAVSCVEVRLDQAAVGADVDKTLFIALENYIYLNEQGEYRDECLLGVRRFCSSTVFSTPMPTNSVLVPGQLHEALRGVYWGLPLTCGEMLGRCKEIADDPRFSSKDWFLAAGASFGRAEQIGTLLAANKNLLVRDDCCCTVNK